MANALDIESRIESEGLASAVRSILDSLPDDDKTRKTKLLELSAVCGVSIGDDPDAWDTWLAGLVSRGVVGIGPLPKDDGIRLPGDASRMADLMDVALQDDTDDESDGQLSLPGYRIIDEIGRGGMATVYKAVQLSLDRVVALKILSDHLSLDAEFIRRFIREAKVAATLAHPNVVTVFDASSSGDTQYFTMEYIEGESLDDILRREGKLGERRALEIALQVARALEYGRTKGIIHRDVKPANVLIDSSGTAKLADMGLARTIDDASGMLTQAGTMMGTPNYISPEQARGDSDIDSRADVYSLGATVFHLLTSRPPFTAKTGAAIVSKHLYEEAPAADSVSPAVSKRSALVIRKTLEKSREQRYQTPREFAADIEAILDGRSPPLASAQYAPRRAWYRSWPILTALSAGAVVLAILAGALLGSEREIAEGPVPETSKAQTPQLAPLDPTLEEHANHATDPAPELQPRSAVDEAALARAEERARIIELGRKVEERGELESAVENYRMALEIEGDAELSAHTDELRRRIQLARALEHADEWAAASKYEAAEKEYRSALTFAEAGESASIRAKIQRMNSMAEYATAIRDARDAHERQAWDDTILAACRALEIIEGDAEATRILKDARGALEANRRYDSAMTEARGSLASSAWSEAVSHAQTALDIRPGDEAAEQVLEKSRNAQRRQRLADEARMSKLLEAARAATQLSHWDEARDRSKEALALDPKSAAATRLLEESEWHLNLPPDDTSSPVEMQLVLVPGGEFLMGSDEGDADEKPVHRVRLDPFYIGTYEVTNAQFEKFDPSHAERRTRFSPGDDMPAVGVSWEDAVAFCDWLSEQEGVTYRLPTEAEWEKAARGTDGAKYPWGNREPTAEAKLLNSAWGEVRSSWADDGARYGAVVGSHEPGKSPYGVHDMAGNVWEWCSDWYGTEAYANSPPENPSGPSEGGCRVFRGGSFANAPSNARASNRSGAEPGLREASLGFRCVRPVSRGEGDSAEGAQ